VILKEEREARKKIPPGAASPSPNQRNCSHWRDKGYCKAIHRDDKRIFSFFPGEQANLTKGPGSRSFFASAIRRLGNGVTVPKRQKTPVAPLDGVPWDG
jgi:hypothetical protein